MRSIKRLKQIGDKKEVRRFLWLPLSVRSKDIMETRWLEYATLAYEYKRVVDIDKARYLPKQWVFIGFKNN